MFIVDIAGWKTKSEKIIGLQKMYDGGLNIPLPVKVVIPDLFAEFKRTGAFSEHFKEEFKSAFQEIRKMHPDKGVAIRTAYYVPNMKAPPGPRIYAEEWEKGLQGLANIFMFAIENKLDVSDSEIAAIMHAHITPRPPEQGGNVFTNYDKEGKYSVIAALYGCGEGVQSCMHDRYLIDINKNKIVKKFIPVKDKCIVVAPSKEYACIDVPNELRERQALDDNTIMELFKQGQKFSKKYGPYELEYLIINNTIFYIHSREYSTFKNEKEIFDEFVLSATSSKEIKDKIRGKVMRVSNENDIGKVKPEHLLFLDPDIIRNRAMSVILKIARLPGSRVVICPISESTAHPLIALKESGHMLIFLGREQEFEDNEMVEITGKGKKIEIIGIK